MADFFHGTRRPREDRKNKVQPCSASSLAVARRTQNSAVRVHGRGREVMHHILCPNLLQFGILLLLAINDIAEF